MAQAVEAQLLATIQELERLKLQEQTLKSLLHEARIRNTPPTVQVRLSFTAILPLELACPTALFFLYACLFMARGHMVWGSAPTRLALYAMHELTLERTCCPPLSSCAEQVCLASSDLLHMHLALAGTCCYYGYDCRYYCCDYYC